VQALAERMTPVSARLGRLRGSMRRLFALDGLARLVLAGFAFVVLTFLVDWTFSLPAYVRLFFLAGGIGLFGWVIVRRLAIPLGAPISDDDLAILVERQFPELNDRLISAIQLAREPMDAPAHLEGGHVVSYNSPELVSALVDDAERAISSLDFSRVVVGRHVGKVLAWALVLGGILGGGAAVRPDYAGIYLNRIAGGSAKWPRRTTLKLLDFVDGRRVVAKGDDLAIAAGYEGVRPSRVLLRYRYDTGEEGAERMTPLAGDRFQFTFTRVTGAFTFTVEGGDDQTLEHRIDVVTPPSIDAVRVWYEYPAYMRKPSTPADRPETVGNVLAPFGTKVRFEAATNEDLKGATLTLGTKGKEKSAPIGVVRTPEGRPRVVSGSFEVNEPLSEYTLGLHAANGLSNRDPIRFTIKGLEDRPPEITVKDPLGDEFITEVCERPLEIEVKDDHGIALVALEVRILSQQKDKSKDWTTFEFGREQNSRDYGEVLLRSEHAVDVSKYGLQAGDHVELRFRAQDYKEPGGANVRLSKVYKLSVVSMGTLEKELQDAIEKIKATLKAQKARQEAAWGKTQRLITTYGRLDVLAPEQQGEVRQAGLEQNDITSKLDAARKDIRQIMRRGVYNKIYNETAAQKLQGAIDALDELVGAADDPAREGLSRLAAARLDQAARLKSGADRTQAFREAQERQNRVTTGIQKALDFLDKWSSYQEVIRIAREIKEIQDRALKDMKKVGGGK
jgi:hypothetical protein